MARAFKIEVDYIGVPQNAVLYWHDTDTVEFETIPQQVTTDSIVTRADLIKVVIGYMKNAKVQQIEITKL